MLNEEITDVSDKFPGCVKAERRGSNVLILERLDTPFQRVDGKRARYQLTYRWLRNHQADLSEVLGEEFTYWLVKEIEFDKGLFDQFQLFS